MNESRTLRAFCSYSHEDQPYHRRLCTSLAQLKREGRFEMWHDGMIIPGQNWANEITEALNGADIVLLLVSPDFLASDHCWNEETLEALRRHQCGLARVIPIILRPCDWKSTPIASLQALPKNGVPVSKYSNEDDAFLEIVDGIRRVIDDVPSRSPGCPTDKYTTVHDHSEPIREVSAAKVELKNVPPGPMVPLYLIPDDLVRELANLLIERAEALALLLASTGILKQLDQHASIVELAHLPAFSAGPYQFWQSAFHEACKHGPRMLAALLLTLPESRLCDRVRGQRRQLLAHLESGSYRLPE